MKYFLYRDQKTKEYVTVELNDDSTLKNPDPNIKTEHLKTLDGQFDRCPLCECRQFYLSKNFNQFVGCLIMGLGIVFVPVTYGLSLPFFALIDWLLYKRVQTLVNCYRCGTEFHNFNTPKRLKPFMHHIGLKYDKYRD